MTTREDEPVTGTRHGQPWPVGAFFLTWKRDKDGARVTHYQGRVLAVDDGGLWVQLYSWMDGSADGIHRIALDADATFYTSDREMRRVAFESTSAGRPYADVERLFSRRPSVPWTAPLPAGFDEAHLATEIFDLGQRLAIDDETVAGGLYAIAREVKGLASAVLALRSDE